MHDIDIDMFEYSNYTYLANNSVSYNFKIICSSGSMMFNYSVPMLEEWNRISFPVNETVDKNDVIVEYLGMNYSWDEAVSEGIILGFIYGWNSSNQNYMFVDVFEPGWGYWMYAYYNCTLWVTSNVYYNDDLISHLMEDWNLIGLPFYISVNKENLTVFYNGSLYSWNEAVSNGIILGFIYGWNASEQNSVFVDILNPGQGYWMFAFYECTLKK